MDARGYQHYKDQSINTMTQGELLLMLYDELVKRLTQAGLALEQKNYPLFEECIDRSLAIIQYLSDTLNMKYEISGNLYKLYDFFDYELRRARIGRNMKPTETVTRMARELRDTFRVAEKQSGSGK